MRIVSGRFRGRPLTPLGKGDPAAHLRPTSDRVRESLFSMLASRGAIEDARVLDLFAGTGALGLEALSRGAQSAVFVDSGRAAQKLLAANIRLLGVAGETRVLAREVLKLGDATGDDLPADLVFLDPPYGKDLGGPVLVALKARGWIAADATIVWEESTPMPAPEGFTVDDQRRYGDTHVTVLRPL
ncbi:16S rRNA (guanine(966)-N(2))-methyltransferase RsmD [Chachezhania antarctica]|uniref:16S rRNA (guanine(966)-N(2))-methyltransferase RsmD n=1 Tax=Chachezhania antarctica TaxID=2340860 RepID=UPI000EB173E5|nr:16S rRNA (guanine(966)-N(2))-methyltransferase RsmD [Chachezhania antarctica]